MNRRTEEEEQDLVGKEVRFEALFASGWGTTDWVTVTYVRAGCFGYTPDNNVDFVHRIVDVRDP